MDEARLSASDLAEMDEADLDRLLGNAVLQDAFLSKIPTPEEAIAVGRAYFIRILPDLKERLCNNPMAVNLFGSEQKERNTIIAALADLVPDLSPVPLVLAARILHYGYDRICKPQQQ
jgi:hypothetical protein